MPKSKRAKVFTLSKTQKKGKEVNVRLYANIRDAVDRYQYCFVFAVDNMRNTYLKDVRSEFNDGRLFFGKTKVMAKALGTTAEEEYQENLSALSKHLSGNVGLIFTDRPPPDVTSYFSTYSQIDYARAGVVSNRDFIIPAGVVYSRGGDIDKEDDVPLEHSLEPMVRQLGMPTRLVKGKVELDQEYVVCREGDTLDSNQTRLLKTFGVAIAEFKIRLLAYWSSATGEVTEVDAMEE